MNRGWALRAGSAWPEVGGVDENGGVDEVVTDSGETDDAWAVCEPTEKVNGCAKVDSDSKEHGDWLWLRGDGRVDDRVRCRGVKHVGLGAYQA